MSLEEYQYILSKILTSSEAREFFLTNRDLYLDAEVISQETKNRLKELSAEQIEEAANALLRKRWGAVKELLQLEEKDAHYLRTFYFEYAKLYPLSLNVFKHQYDALNFAENHLPQDLETKLKEHISHRVHMIRNYLKQEGEKINAKPRWRRFLKI